MPSVDLVDEFRYDKYHETNQRAQKYYMFFKCFYYILLIVHFFNPFYWFHKYRFEAINADGIFVTVEKAEEVKYCSKIYGRFLAGVSLSLYDFDDYDFSDLLKYCPKIIYLNIAIFGKPMNSDAIIELKNLKSLSCDQYFKAKLDLEGNDRLESLSVGYKNLKNGIPYLPKLRNLTISNFGKSNLEELQKLPNLKYLSMIQSKNLENLDYIDKIEHLEYITLYGLNKLKSLGEIGNLKALRYLIFERCRNLSDISGLHGAKALEYIYFYECNSLGDLRPLISCQNLVDLHLRVETNLDSSYDEVVKALPKLRYSGLHRSRRRKPSIMSPPNETNAAQDSL